MKRPEGFDAAGDSGSAHVSSEKNRRNKRDVKRGATSASNARPTSGRPASEPTEASLAHRGNPENSAKSRSNVKRELRLQTKADKRQLRRATAVRRRTERGEVRRFTRRSRRRRITVFSLFGVVGLLLILVAVAVFSPLLALREIRIEGSTRVDAQELTGQLNDLIGTPLALVDYGRIDQVLRGYSHIRSYSTQTIPPHTIVIRLVEREPILARPGGSGFQLVDPAGVVLEETADRPSGLPVLNTTGSSSADPGFETAVAALSAMPGALRAEIDTISASTRDDVVFTLTDSGQSVRWGSATDSQQKARLLLALRELHGTTPGVFDVSAPGNGIFRQS